MTEIVQDTLPRYPELRGKVAVVTGGSKGIGAATASALAANGSLVAVVARGQEDIDRIVDRILRAGGEAMGLTADCTRLSEVQQVRTEVSRQLGPIDFLVPFAGGFGPFTPIQEITEEDWNDTINSNLTSTFLTVKAFLPDMMERRQGAIVTMASNAARLLDMPLTASYAAAKAGVMVFTRHVAKEVGVYGIRVNCVAPATTLSERVQRNMPAEMQQRVADMSPLGRLGTPLDSALATLFLLSDSASWLTGVTLDIAGGRVML